MQQFDSLIFDLDGTLWDTSESCVLSWNAILDTHKIPFRKITLDDIRTITGMPHEECIRSTFAGLPEETLQFMIEQTIIEDNRMVAEIGGRLYDGVDHGLRLLSEKYKVCIVSNCQAGYIEAFLDWGNLRPYITDFECWGNLKRSKSENTAAVISRNKLRAPLFIGDTTGDAHAARASQIPFAYMSYGFGAVADFDHRFDSFTTLTEWLLR